MLARILSLFLLTVGLWTTADAIQLGAVVLGGGGGPTTGTHRLLPTLGQSIAAHKPASVDLVQPGFWFSVQLDGPQSGDLIALEDRTQVNYSGIFFNRRRGQTKVNVYVVNTSDTALDLPLWLVFEPIEADGVTLTNPDGTTADDRLYIDLGARLAGVALEPGGQTPPVTLIFSNSARRRFSLQAAVFRPVQGPDLSKPVALLSTPAEYLLAQNVPNPFNPITTIRYNLPEAAPVRLQVFNALGQQVRLLTDQMQAAGEYRVQWDGRDQAGRATASGLYIYRLQAGPHVATRKMLLTR